MGIRRVLASISGINPLYSLGLVALVSVAAGCGQQASFSDRTNTTTAKAPSADATAATGSGGTPAAGGTAGEAGAASGADTTGAVTTKAAVVAGGSGAGSVGGNTASGSTAGQPAAGGTGASTGGSAAGGTGGGTTGLAANATGSGSGSGGSTGGTTGGKTGGTTSGVTVTPPGPIVIPPGCDQTGATQANLITTSLQNGAANAYIEYQVFRTDCQGNVMALTADKIAFDIDAKLPSFMATQYTLKAGATMQQGVLDEVVGADLFGNSGPTYAHWETDQAVSIEGITTSVVLRVDLPDTTLVPRTGPATALSTYLKFGSAAAVTKVVVLVN